MTSFEKNCSANDSAESQTGSSFPIDMPEVAASFNASSRLLVLI